MLVRYELGAKGYQLWDKHTCSIKLSRDVMFDESVFLSQQGVELHSALLSPTCHGRSIFAFIFEVVIIRYDRSST